MCKPITKLWQADILKSFVIRDIYVVAGVCDVRIYIYIYIYMYF